MVATRLGRRLFASELLQRDSERLTSCAVRAEDRAADDRADGLGCARRLGECEREDAGAEDGADEYVDDEFRDG